MGSKCLGMMCGNRSSQVSFAGERHTFYVRYMGCKGDWPFLRTAMRLRSGYTSKRVCHLCPLEDAWFLSLSCCWPP